MTNMYLHLRVFSLIIVVSLTLSACKQDVKKTQQAPLEDQFFPWAVFSARFEEEMVRAEELYQRIKSEGYVEYAFHTLDFSFESDQEQHVKKLGQYLTDNYVYQEMQIRQNGQLWELTGKTTRIPISAEILRYWALDMYKRGYEHHCRLVKYGRLPDQGKVAVPNWSPQNAEAYRKQGEALYQQGNISGALINWTLSLQIDPKNPNCYYLRAIVKDELYTYKSALTDYDRAIELAPDFVSAWINRGALKDENGDHTAALTDLNHAAELAKNDQRQLRMALFNRGNAKQHLKDASGACADWKESLRLGGTYAQEKITTYCK